MTFFFFKMNEEKWKWGCGGREKGGVVGGGRVEIGIVMKKYGAWKRK